MEEGGGRKMGMKESGQIRKKEKNPMEKERDERKTGEGATKTARVGVSAFVVVVVSSENCFRMCAGLIAAPLALKHTHQSVTHVHTHMWLSPW